MLEKIGHECVTVLIKRERKKKGEKSGSLHGWATLPKSNGQYHQSGWRELLIFFFHHTSCGDFLSKINFFSVQFCCFLLLVITRAKVMWLVIFFIHYLFTLTLLS